MRTYLKVQYFKKKMRNLMFLPFLKAHDKRRYTKNEDDNTLTNLEL